MLRSEQLLPNLLKKSGSYSGYSSVGASLNDTVKLPTQNSQLDNKILELTSYTAWKFVVHCQSDSSCCFFLFIVIMIMIIMQLRRR